MVFNATFNNISVILWWSVLLVEENYLLNEQYDNDDKGILNFICDYADYAILS
jgi:hypothetical protein